ncbi:MAG: hypothetical protein IT292_08850 [Deltaproteobacteria bacterium]|nr:hypothetical protein [Deltaproteobacteria bacterium]
MSIIRLLVSLLLLTLMSGCSTAQKDKSTAIDNDLVKNASVPPSVSVGSLASGEQKSPTPEEAEKKLEEYSENWFYGYGLGRSILNIGTVVIFPPYAIYLVGNAALQVAGEEPLYVTDALPEKPKDAYMNVYNGVTGIPGMLSSTVAGVPFREETK